MAATTGATGALTISAFFSSFGLAVASSFFKIGAETGGVGCYTSFFGSSFFFSYGFFTSVTFCWTGATGVSLTETGFGTETFSNGASSFLDSTLT